MEDVLEIYAQPYDSRHPVVCMDEQPVQLIGETRVSIAATKKHAKRMHYEYERWGTASIFMFAEPLSAFRQATARPQRTKSDWALEVAHLLDTRYTKCETITLVSDNLNTHTMGAFYEAFPPEQARAYVKRLNLVHTWYSGGERAAWRPCVVSDAALSRPIPRGFRPDQPVWESRRSRTRTARRRRASGPDGVTARSRCRRAGGPFESPRGGTGRCCDRRT